MFYPSLNQHTGEARCVGNPVEYHKLQYLNMSDSAHIWIPSWRNKKQRELEKQKKGKKCCKNCHKKFEVEGLKLKKYGTNSLECQNCDSVILNLNF